MGLAMAGNVQKYLQREGKPALKIWNRTASRGEPLVEMGAVACESIAGLVVQCDIVFISVSVALLISISSRHRLDYRAMGWSERAFC